MMIMFSPFSTLINNIIINICLFFLISILLNSGASSNNNDSNKPFLFVLSQQQEPQPTSTSGKSASQYTRGVAFLDLVYTLSTEDSLAADPIRNDHLFRINIGHSGFDGKAMAVNFALPTIDLSGYRRKETTKANNSSSNDQQPFVPLYDNALLMLYCDTTKYVDENDAVLDVPKEILDEDSIFETTNHGKNSIFGTNLCNTVDLFLKLPTIGASRAQWLFQKVSGPVAKSADLLNFTAISRRSQQNQGNFLNQISLTTWQHILLGQKYCRDFYDECLFHAFSCSTTYQNTKIFDNSEAFPVYNLASRYYPTTQYRNLWTAISSPQVAAVMPSDSDLALYGPFGNRMSASFINLEQNAWLMTINRLPPTRMLEVHEPFSPSDQATIIMQFEVKPSRLHPEGFIFAGTLLSAAVLVGICLFLIICKAIVPRILYLRQIESEGMEEALERIDGELIERFEKQRLAEEKRNSLIARLGRVTGAPLTPDDLEALEDWTKLPVGEMIHDAILEERKRAMLEKLSTASDKFAAIPRVMFARALRLLDKSLFSTEIKHENEEAQQQEEGVPQQQQQQQQSGNDADAAWNQQDQNHDHQQRHSQSNFFRQDNSAESHLQQQHARNAEGITRSSTSTNTLGSHPAQVSRNSSFSGAAELRSKKSKYNLKSDAEIDADNIADADVFALFTDATKQTAGNVKDAVDSTTATIKSGVVFAGDLAVGVVSGAAHLVESGAQKVVEGANKVLGTIRGNKNENGSEQQGDENKQQGNQYNHHEQNEDQIGSDGAEAMANKKILSHDVLSPEDNRARFDDDEHDGSNDDSVDLDDQDDAFNPQNSNSYNNNSNQDGQQQPSSAMMRTPTRPATNNKNRINLPRLNLEKLHQQQFQETTPKLISGLTLAAAAGASPHHENNHFFEQQVEQVNRNLAQYSSSQADAAFDASGSIVEIGGNTTVNSHVSLNNNNSGNQLSVPNNHESQHRRSYSVGGIILSPLQKPPTHTTVVQMTSTRRFKLAAQAARISTSLPRNSVPRHSRQSSVPASHHHIFHQPQHISVHRRSMSVGGVNNLNSANSMNTFNNKNNNNSNSNFDSNSGSAANLAQNTADHEAFMNSGGVYFEDILERHLQEDRRLLDDLSDHPLPSHSFDPFSNESRPEDVPHCRRCGEVLPFIDLFAPCNCTSTSTRYIHRSCLEAERRIDAFSEGGRHAEFCFRCRICRARYRIAPSSISMFGAVPMKSPLAQTINKLINNPVAPMLAMWVMVWVCGYLVKFVSATLTLDYLATDWSALRIYHWVLGAFFLLSFSLCERSLQPFFEIFSFNTRRICVIVVACVAPLLFGYVGHFLMKFVSTIAWTWESFFGLGFAIEFLLFAWVVPKLALFVARGAGHLYDRLPLSVQRCLQKVIP